MHEMSKTVSGAQKRDSITRSAVAISVFVFAPLLAVGQESHSSSVFDKNLAVMRIDIAQSLNVVGISGRLQGCIGVSHELSGVWRVTRDFKSIPRYCLAVTHCDGIEMPTSIVFSQADMALPESFEPVEGRHCDMVAYELLKTIGDPVEGAPKHHSMVGVPGGVDLRQRCQLSLEVEWIEYQSSDRTGNEVSAQPRQNRSRGHEKVVVDWKCIGREAAFIGRLGVPIGSWATVEGEWELDGSKAVDQAVFHVTRVNERDCTNLGIGFAWSTMEDRDLGLFRGTRVQPESGERWRIRCYEVVAFEADDRVDRLPIRRPKPSAHNLRLDCGLVYCFESALPGSNKSKQAE